MCSNHLKSNFPVNVRKPIILSVSEEMLQGSLEAGTQKIELQPYEALPSSNSEAHCKYTETQSMKKIFIMGWSNESFTSSVDRRPYQGPREFTHYRISLAANAEQKTESGRPIRQARAKILLYYF